MQPHASSSFERAAINRRAKHLSMARPFFALEAGKGHAEINLEPYDLHRVAMVILDCIIVEMGGLHRGASYDTIFLAVQPCLIASNPKCTDSEADRITSYALDALTNERAREAFRATYQIQDESGAMRWVSSRYWLVLVKEGPQGDPVYTADTPAINFYLTSLEQDIEAAQAAKDGAHEYYMQRGRFGDAGQNAEDSLKLTISYREKLLRSVAVLSRDIRSINYTEDIIPTLNEATRHINNRMEIEARHTRDVDERLDIAKGEALAQLSRLKEIFHRTSAFYSNLSAEVIGLDGKFLEEQTRQRFRPLGSLLGVGDPVSQVLTPALSLPAKAVVGWVEAHPNRFFAPTLATVPCLTDLVSLLLQDPQERVAGEIVSEGDVENLDPLVRFPAAECEAVAKIFDQIQVSARLGDLLGAARAAGLGAPGLRLIVLRALHSYEHGGAFQAEIAGELRDPDYSGNELLIIRHADQ